MAHAQIEDIRKHVRAYLVVFAALAALTVITVAISRVDFGAHSINIVIGLLIATIKASLVALYFMHLISEKQVIYAVLALTVIFFIGLLFIPVFTEADNVKVFE